MQIQNAAPLVYTRTKNVGFRSGFVVQPDDFRDSTAKKLVQYAHDAMDSIAEMRSNHKHACVVIAEDGFVVAGISAYLRDMVIDGWQGNDKGGRLVYGFFGYVWHKEDFTTVTGFPVLEEFNKILEDWIRPHWEDSANSKWADTLQSGGYNYTVKMQNVVPLNGYSPRGYRKNVVIDNADRENVLVQWALERASRGENVAVCTNVCVYSENDLQTRYQYITRLKEVNSTKRTTVETNPPLTHAQPEKEVHSQTENRQTMIREIKSDMEYSKGGEVPLFSIAGVVCLIMAAVFLVMGRYIPVMKSFGWIWILLVCLGIVILILQNFRQNSMDKKKKASGYKEPVQPVRKVGATVQKPIHEQKVSQGKKPVPDPQKKPAKKETTEDVFRL